MTAIRVSGNAFSVTACGRTWDSAPWECRILRKDGGFSDFSDADCETLPFRCGAGQGVSQIVRSKADYIISIPMKGRVNSLNASNAAAIMLYEVNRQRNL